MILGRQGYMKKDKTGHGVHATKQNSYILCSHSICILAIILVVSILVLYVAKNVIQAFQVYVLVSKLEG